MTPRRARGAMTLVEILVIAIPALFLLGLILHLVVRGFATERWNAGRRAGLDSVLIATEHLRADLAASAGGQVEVGETLAIPTGDALTPAPGSTATYAPVAAGFLTRNGTPLRAAPLASATWAWDASAASLLRVELAADPRGAVTYAAGVHLPDRAARLEYPAFADR